MRYGGTEASLAFVFSLETTIGSHVVAMRQKAAPVYFAQISPMVTFYKITEDRCLDGNSGTVLPSHSDFPLKFSQFYHKYRSVSPLP